MFLGHVTITIWPLWALMNGATSSPVFGPIFLFKGIFAQVLTFNPTQITHLEPKPNSVKCAQYMPGQFQCDNYLRPVFTLTSFELVQRTFAILSCILLGIALILMLVGMETSKIFLREENVHIKMKLMKVRFSKIKNFPEFPKIFLDDNSRVPPGLAIW